MSPEPLRRVDAVLDAVMMMSPEPLLLTFAVVALARCRRW